MITLKYNFKSIQKGLYEILQNAVKIINQSIGSSEPAVYYKNRVTNQNPTRQIWKTNGDLLRFLFLRLFLSKAVAINPKYDKTKIKKLILLFDFYGFV